MTVRQRIRNARIPCRALLPTLQRGGSIHRFREKRLGLTDIPLKCMGGSKGISVKPRRFSRKR